MKIWKFEFTFNRVEKSPEDRLHDAAEEMTAAWHNAYKNRCGIKPWIDWSTKEIQIVEHVPYVVSRTGARTAT